MKTCSEFRAWSLEFGASAVAMLFVCGSVFAGSNPYRGLWVGQANLNYVTEVTVPLDENNVAIAPDPKVPTKTGDQAQIRLILHVNGAGQVNLLKEVAVMRRTDASETNLLYNSEADYSLVTDDRLYPDFPEQVAKRICSVVFDFGDIKATEAVDAIVKTVSESVASSVMGGADEQTAESTAIAATGDVVPNADVAETYDAFLKDKLPKLKVTEIANDPALIDGLRPQAQTLAGKSFYNDTRALELLDALETAIDGAPDGGEDAVAQNTVARYADVENLYERYVHGIVFGNMIRGVALAAATKAASAGVTRVVIDAAARLDDTYSAAGADAVRAKVAAYDDTRSTDALESVVSNIVDAAYIAATGQVVVVNELASQLEAVGFAAQAGLQQGFVSINTPSADYTEFVRSSEFSGAVQTAADAAASAAVSQTREDPFYTESDLEGAARIAAYDALTTIYAQAGRAKQTELPLAGLFGMGEGDPRIISTIASTDAPLGAAALTGTIKLPANHPTNPFRHRRHPDHTVGFDIERRLRFDFNGASTNDLQKTGLGVECITGTYREEIFGLHKPLGPDPSANPIGLKVEGPFELNRISLIDTLNAR